jgi:uncharacterized phiE125 gp8 family phage protein
MSVDLTLAKAHCRVTHSAEDTLITQYMASAKAWVERYTGLLVEETEVTDSFLEFGDYLQLTRGPFVALVEIAYTDTSGDPQVVADARVQDGKIYPPLTGWPSIETYSMITVTYDAGYGGYNPVPEELTAAQLLLIGHWYNHREAVVIGDAANEVPFAVEALAGPFRLPTIA